MEKRAPALRNNPYQSADLEKIFREVAEKWPSSVVARERISDFTGGAISPGRLANLDSQGLGPAGRVRIGRKIVYPVGNLISWLIERSEAVA